MTKSVETPVAVDQKSTTEKETFDAVIKEAQAAPLVPLTEEHIRELVDKSSMKPGAKVVAKLGREIKALEAPYEAARDEWLDSLAQGDIVRYKKWHNPVEIVCIDRSDILWRMAIRDLGDGEIEDEVDQYDVNPYDGVAATNRANAHRVKNIATRLTEAATMGDTATIDALEAALNSQA